jgi:hypothetical protein
MTESEFGWPGEISFEIISCNYEKVCASHARGGEAGCRRLFGQAF